MSLKRNIVANYLGQGWRALLQLAFVPLYIAYLGIESYGVIGLFATLQAWLALLDMGLRPVLSREMARFTGGAIDAQGIATILRTVELLALGVATLFAGLVWAASGWLATDWLNVARLPTQEVAHALALMGVVTGLQFLESLYSSAIAGVQRQVLQNAIMSAVVTLRTGGAVAILAFVSPTITAFFLWQGAVSLLSVAALAIALYRILPRPERPARFSGQAVREVRAYATGMIGIALLSFLLTQIDKILLSRQLPLAEFGHYALAGVVAGAVAILTTPVGAAFFPRFTELVARKDEAGLRAAFHRAAQLMACQLSAAAAVLIAFGEPLIRLWTGDPGLAREVAPIAALLGLGTLFSGLITAPYLIQLAYGRTALMVRINVVAVVILAPAILLIVPYFGAIGAASIWASLNLAYITIGAHFMFSDRLRTEKRAWYLQDILAPVAVAAVVAGTARLLMPLALGIFAQVAYLAVAGAATLAAAALSTPVVREMARRLMADRKLRTIAQ